MRNGEYRMLNIELGMDRVSTRRARGTLDEVIRDFQAQGKIPTTKKVQSKISEKPAPNCLKH